MRYILGIDGGGTKTQAAIVDEHGRLLGIGLGGPANYDSVGIEVAQSSIAQAVASARSRAGLREHPLAAAFLGVAGVVSPGDHTIVRDMALALSLAPADYIGIDHDCRIALAGGLSGRPGIVLIVGTGSSCYGLNAQGKAWRAGGWGHLISDEGSSYWFGVQAMRAAVMSYDGRSGPTLLVDAVKRQFVAHDLQDLMHRIYVPGLSKHEIAALAPAVIDAARVGDEAALDLLRQGMRELALCVWAVAHHLDLADGICELTLVGGLLRAGAVVLNLLRDEILSRLPQCRLTLPEMPPVFGAALLGLQTLGVTVNAPVIAALRAGAAALEPPS
jgi:N-acetylglucosamine kinase-like BadF-type ATPase